MINNRIKKIIINKKDNYGNENILLKNYREKTKKKYYLILYLIILLYINNTLIFYSYALSDDDNYFVDNNGNPYTPQIINIDSISENNSRNITIIGNVTITSDHIDIDYFNIIVPKFVSINFEFQAMNNSEIFIKAYDEDNSPVFINTINNTIKIINKNNSNYYNSNGFVYGNVGKWKSNMIIQIAGNGSYLILINLEKINNIDRYKEKNNIKEFIIIKTSLIVEVALFYIILNLISLMTLLFINKYKIFKKNIIQI